MKIVSGLAAAVGVLLFATACSESGAGGREVAITQQQDGCTPTTIEVTGGEKVQFVVTNESDHDVYEVEGIDGTKLEEFIVPAGKTRKAGFTIPDGDGTHRIKCYVPTGPSTIIELVAGEGGAASGVTPEADPDPEADSEGGSADADTVVATTLSEYKIEADKASVPAGKIKFTSTNISETNVHELAVLKVEDGEATENLGEIEDVPAGGDGELVLDLEPGEYELACLIVAGEAGSTADHYEEGMHMTFTVTE